MIKVAKDTKLLFDGTTHIAGSARSGLLRPSCDLTNCITITGLVAVSTTAAEDLQCDNIVGNISQISSLHY